jgi:hypothetical protein
MEIVTANVAGKARETTYHGRKYLVAPMTLIVPGVLNGSQGPLYYPLEEVRKDPHAWNHIPIVVYHPMKNGRPVSARRPEILEKSGIGHLFNTHASGCEGTHNVNCKLGTEGWFDVERARVVDSRVLAALETNTPMELSTGLTLEQEPAPQGAVYNSPGGPRPYVAIARNYRPDHLAVLPDQKGACSVLDGCGVLVNHENPLARRSTYFDGLVLLTNGYERTHNVNSKKDQPRVPAGSSKGGQFAPKAGEAAAPTAGRHDKVAGTDYSRHELAEAALKAGRGLFGNELVFDPVTSVKSVKLSTLQKKSEEEGGYVDEYEYVFHPSTGKGKDVSSSVWTDAKPSWADKDGKIYTVWGGVIRVVHVDVPLGGGGRSREPKAAPIKEGASVKFKSSLGDVEGVATGKVSKDGQAYEVKVTKARKKHYLKVGATTWVERSSMITNRDETSVWGLVANRLLIPPPFRHLRLLTTGVGQHRL